MTTEQFRKEQVAPHDRSSRPRHSLCSWLALALVWLLHPSAHAGTVLGPWTPLFKGIDHAVGTNTAGGGGFPNLQVIHAIRVDLSDPDIELFATPRLANYVANWRETAGLQVKDFLTTYKLQIAINGGFFDPSQYYLPAGTPMDASGLLMSRGEVVSTQDSAAYAATVAFASNNVPRVIHTNWPPVSTTGIHTAVSGDYPLLVAGVNVGYSYLGQPGAVHGVQPRTAYGVSRDGRTLYLLAIDGRQPGYSSGALDWETGAWLLLLGAYDAVNMDGGGSTTLVMADSVGNPVELNKPSSVADSGRERTVGSHLGVYAKPVPAFINDVVAISDDTAATVTWTTTAPATSQIEYGLTADLGTLTAVDSRRVTNHAVLLTGLGPGTTYYCVARSTVDGRVEQSPPQVFTTTNYVTTNAVFDLDHEWKFTAANLDGLPWTTRTYDDGAWSGPGPGLLWIDVRATPNASVQPKGAQLPADPAHSGYPYRTYYFRTRFAYPPGPAASALVFAMYVDDGAVFYLNGHEVHRHEMAEAPALIANDTLAAGYSCAGGDATCVVDLALVGEPATHLLEGDNVLAVEVHNYNERSPDITFGASFAITRQNPPATPLEVSLAGGAVRLSWARSGMILQQAPEASGPWTDAPGPVFVSPYSVPVGAAAQYYRLRR